MEEARPIPQGGLNRRCHDAEMTSEIGRGRPSILGKTLRRRASDIGKNQATVAFDIIKFK